MTIKVINLGITFVATEASSLKISLSYSISSSDMGALTESVKCFAAFDE